MRRWFIRSREGYTLVEVLTGLFITSMVLVLLVTSLQFGGEMAGKITGKMIRGQESRRACLFLQKQLSKSREMVVKDGRVYLQDMENPDYYNFIRLKRLEPSIEIRSIRRSWSPLRLAEKVS